MNIPTTMSVQLLGRGNVVLMSASNGTEMNVNFVISDDEFLRMVQALMEQSANYPESKLNLIGVKEPTT